MPVNIPDTMPASQILASENIFVMHRERATHQDIRPLRVAILNLMPTKEVTETQLLRLLGNTSIQVEPVFLYTESYVPTHTDPSYLDAFYRTFDQVKDSRFDGFIITGAPIEHKEFEEVAYWPELARIMDWAHENVFSTLHICWGAQAALYYQYGIPKYPLAEKCFGVFCHKVLAENIRLLRGFDAVFNAPHSRHTEVRRADIEKHPDLMILAESDEAGVYLIADKSLRHVYVTGHSEYDADTLEREYLRDVASGRSGVSVPKNYYPGDDPSNDPMVTWRAHANLLFGNWLNYCVYQETPYDLGELKR